MLPNIDSTTIYITFSVLDDSMKAISSSIFHDRKVCRISRYQRKRRKRCRRKSGWVGFALSNCDTSFYGRLIRYVCIQEYVKMFLKLQ